MIKNSKKGNTQKLWLILVITIGVIGNAIIWWGILKEYIVLQDSKSGKNLVIEKITEEVDSAGNLRRCLRYIRDGVYLINDKEEIICGPYKAIELKDINRYCQLCRFIDDNGLIGYLSSTDGEVVILPQFVQASEMEGGVAFVRDENDGYYINGKGERITNNEYLYGYPFSELQGLCARVQMPDGSVGIIDRKENILLEGCEMIHELPGALTYGSAVKDGKAILFEIILGEEIQLDIIKQYEEYCDISEVYMEGFAIVENGQGLKGAVCVWNGEVIIPVEYKSLEIEYLQTEEIGKEIILFKLKNKNEKYENFIWEN